MFISIGRSSGISPASSSTIQGRPELTSARPLTDGVDRPQASESSSDECQKAQNKLAAAQLAFYTQLAGAVLGGNLLSAGGVPATVIALGELEDKVQQQCKPSNDPKQGSDNQQGASGNSGAGGAGGK